MNNLVQLFSYLVESVGKDNKIFFPKSCIIRDRGEIIYETYNC